MRDVFYTIAMHYTYTLTLMMAKPKWADWIVSFAIAIHLMGLVFR